MHLMLMTLLMSLTHLRVAWVGVATGMPPRIHPAVYEAQVRIVEASPLARNGLHA